jgi:hypothetical protein
MVRVACRGLLGAIRSPWLAQSRWLTALLFTHTILIAPSTAQRLFRSLVASMVDGSHQIWLGHSKVKPIAASGDGCSSLVIKHCAGPVLQPIIARTLQP